MTWTPSLLSNKKFHRFVLDFIVKTFSNLDASLNLTQASFLSWNEDFKEFLISITEALAKFGL